MSRIKIIPAGLNGKINIPSSKSISHRLIIAASLSKGISNIENISYSKDILATIDCLRNFGAEIEEKQHGLIIKGSSGVKFHGGNLNCSESGSTLRFLIPIALTVDNSVNFHGQGKLIERPLNTYFKIFDEKNIKYRLENGRLPLHLEGKLESGIYNVEGNVSSQFITGLLYSLPLLDGNSEINITSKLESKGYIDLTIDTLKKFGIDIENKDYKKFIIEGNKTYRAGDFRVEGDFSQAAFFLAAGILGGTVSCQGLNIASLQGDKEIINIIRKMGGDIKIEGNDIKASKSETHGIIIDVSDFPDLVPIIAVIASVSLGRTEIINASRLRIKESDRLKAISAELNKLGADVTELQDSLIINGRKNLYGGSVISYNDHRIAMALSIAAIRCKNPVTIDGIEAVNKSYPGFWEDYKMIGGNLVE
ncbi:MAG: 3-phosphoshikimate 1-carboxyvinyltransferase [Bacillota bacterium]|nr:3-phosphoshikimate 1-carboxyvinyltransferase [Bacillota bacterium]